MVLESPQRSSGFTLIEILVVMVVVGMLVALATFTLGGNSLRRDLDNEAQQMFLLMQTVSEQALLNNSELGLLLEEDGYRFLAYEEQSGSWKPPQDRLYRQRQIPEWMVVTDYIESDVPRLASSDDEVRPDIVLFSSGETTPFELELSLGTNSPGNDDYVHRIISDGVGPMQWQHPGRVATEEP